MVRKTRRNLDERIAVAFPDKVRMGPLREGTFQSDLHSRSAGSILGIALGVTFTICFVTGLLSWAVQNPPNWFLWPSRPVGLYRITQGLHVATGIASIPLLLAKLWVVYPKLWRWPPIESVAHAIERISLLPLVGGSLFLLFAGVASITRWVPYPFSFPTAHFWAAWITIGALIVHVGAKAALIRPSLSRPRVVNSDKPSGVRAATNSLSRRGFLWTVAAAAGTLTLVTVGQTVSGLQGIALLAPRRPSEGPQGFPVNKTAGSAGVTDLANAPDYQLSVEGNVQTPLTLSLDQLRAMPQTEAALPISCVDGWSANVRWKGVRVADLLQMAGAPDGATAVAESLQAHGPYRNAELNAAHAHDSDTLLALEANGQVLDIDHGYPVRLVGPNRPGVMQTKWVGKLVVH